MDENKKRPLEPKESGEDQVVDDEDENSESESGSGNSSNRSTGSEPDGGSDRKVAARPTDGDTDDQNDDNQQERQGDKKRMRTASGRPENKVSHEQRWNEMFSRVVAFKEKFGHCLVPNRYPADTQLGFWVSAQRRQYKLLATQGESASALTPERVRKLESIGFQWSSTNPHHTPWETRYKELCDFVKKYGHAEVPIRWKENPKLSHWVSKQRHDMKLRQQGRSNRLTDRKVNALNEVGFLWEGDKRSRRNLQEKASLEDTSSDTNANGAPVTPSADSNNVASETSNASGLAAAPAATDSSSMSFQGSQASTQPAAGAQNPFLQMLGNAGVGNYQQGQQPLVAAIIFPVQGFPGQNQGGQSGAAQGIGSSPMILQLNPSTGQPTVSQPPVSSAPAAPQGNPAIAPMIDMLAKTLAPLLMQSNSQSQAPMASLAPFMMPAQQLMQQPGTLQSLEQQLQLMFGQGAAQQPSPPIAQQQQQQQQQQPQVQQQAVDSGLNQEAFLRAIQQTLTGGQQLGMPTSAPSAPAAQQSLANPQHLSELLRQFGVQGPNYGAPAPSHNNSGTDPPTGNQSRQQG